MKNVKKNQMIWCILYYNSVTIKLIKGKHSLHGKIAASVLLKLFISGKSVAMKDATPLTPPIVLAELYIFLNVNNIQSLIPKDQKNITTQVINGHIKAFFIQIPAA